MRWTDIPKAGMAALAAAAVLLTACERGTEPEAPQVEAPETVSPAVDPAIEQAVPERLERGMAPPEEAPAPVDSPYAEEGDQTDLSTPDGMQDAPELP